MLSCPGAHSWLPRPPDGQPRVLPLRPAGGCGAASAGSALALLGLLSHHEANKTLKRLLSSRLSFLGPDCLFLRRVCLHPSLLCVLWLGFAPHVTVLADVPGPLQDGDPSVSSGRRERVPCLGALLSAEWLLLGLAGAWGRQVLVAGEGRSLAAPRLDRGGDVRPGGDALPVLDYLVDGSQRHSLLVFGHCPVFWSQDALLPGQVRKIQRLPMSGSLGASRCAPRPGCSQQRCSAVHATNHSPQFGVTATLGLWHISDHWTCWIFEVSGPDLRKPQEGGALP